MNVKGGRKRCGWNHAKCTFLQWTSWQAWRLGCTHNVSTSFNGNQMMGDASIVHWKTKHLCGTRCSQKGDSVSFSLTPNFNVQIGEVCGPYICTQATKNTKMAAKWRRKQQEKASVCWGGFQKIKKNSCSTICWSAVQKSKSAQVSSGKVYIIVDQNGQFSWFWWTNFSFLYL